MALVMMRTRINRGGGYSDGSTDRMAEKDGGRMQTVSMIDSDLFGTTIEFRERLTIPLSGPYQIGRYPIRFGCSRSSPLVHFQW